MEIKALIDFEPSKRANIERFLENDTRVFRYNFFGTNSVAVVVVRDINGFSRAALHVSGVLSVKL